MNRREFIRRVGQVSAAAVLGGCTQQRHLKTNNKSYPPNIIVVLADDLQVVCHHSSLSWMR